MVSIGWRELNLSSQRKDVDQRLRFGVSSEGDDSRRWSTGLEPCALVD